MIFIGSLDDKIKFTFRMYDFDNDGLITPEDIRLLMSYMPFKRNTNVMESRGRKRQHMAPPRRLRSCNVEGLLQEGEGKNIDFNDRMNDQEEIRTFIHNIFKGGHAGMNNRFMNLS